MQIKTYKMPKIQTKMQTKNNTSYTAQLAEEVFYWVPVCRVQYHLYKLGHKSALVNRVTRMLGHCLSIQIKICNHSI
jgi:hypothetical protein